MQPLDIRDSFPQNNLKALSISSIIPIEEGNQEISRSGPAQIIELGPTHARLKQMKCDVFLIKVLQGLKYAFEVRFLVLTPFSQEFWGSTNRSLQDLNIADSVNSNPQGLKGTDISTETVPSKKLKSTVIEVVPQTVFLSKTKFLLKELQHSSTAPPLNPSSAYSGAKGIVLPTIA